MLELATIAAIATLVSELYYYIHSILIPVNC